MKLTTLVWLFFFAWRAANNRVGSCCAFVLPHNTFVAPFFHAQTATVRLYNQQKSQSMEALHSLEDFHGGTWDGTLFSFGITDDVAAGIVKRQEHQYETNVAFRNDDGYCLQETILIKTSDNENGKDDSTSDEYTRRLSIDGAFDVDSVDASYSGQTASPFLEYEFDTCLEHTLAVSDNDRTRCLALYQSNNHLDCIVLLHETRRISDTTPAGIAQPQGITAQDFIDLQSDVDRIVDKITGESTTTTTSSDEVLPSPPQLDPMEQLQKAMTNSDSNSNLVPTRITLPQLTSGSWQGDCVIRDFSLSAASAKRGFGGTSSSSGTARRFASWTVGVQKLAWQWLIDFLDDETTIQYRTEYGKSLGAGQKAGLSAITGTVQMNEGVSRKVPKHQRVVFCEFEKDALGFLVDDSMILLPRVLSKRASQYTEFNVFQTDDKEIICSRIARNYKNGVYMQGTTGFFQLDPYGY